MPVPATSGALRTDVLDMTIGDYISCEFNYNTGFAKLGAATKPELPVTGNSNADGSFYFIKVDRGLLIADRVIWHSKTSDSFNSSSKFPHQGRTLPNMFSDASYGTLQGTIRMPSGGCAFATAQKTKSHLDQGLGAWPLHNEWDLYIVKSTLGGKAIPGSDAVWHWSNVWTFTLDNPISNFLGDPATTNRTARICRGNTSAQQVGKLQGTYSGSNAGYRPVLQYKE